MKHESLRRRVRVKTASSIPPVGPRSVGPLLAALLVLACAAGAARAQGARVGVSQEFKGPTGLQLYSLRREFKQDAPGTFAKVKGYGFREVEVAGVALPASEIKSHLDKHGLKAVGFFAPYESVRDKLGDVIGDARTLGAEYVIVGWIPHQRGAFNLDNAREAAAVFNRAGEELSKAGLKFAYHIHGYEFQPHEQGTLFDVLAKETNPKFVNFELDVFWVVHPGQDPVKLLQKYGKRIHLMHLKDLQKGVKGDLTGGAPDSTNVPLGTGQVDWKAVLGAAQKAGVKWYFIEDESEHAAHQIPESLRHLEQLRLK
jgi:sugar phosphate isomerase/epimerase